MDDQTFFKKQIAGLSEYFNKELSEILIKLYWQKLKHLSNQEFLHSINRCIDELSFFPKINEIINRLPEKKALHHKGSLSWCDSTQSLIERYLPEGRNKPKHKPI